MALSKNLKKQWRVERRLSRKHKWVGKGLFETRSAAREKAKRLRDGYRLGESVFWIDGLGFGNTRVVPYVKGQK